VTDPKSTTAAVGILAAAPSSTIRAKLSLATPALRSVSARLWHPDGLAERYRRYLGTMYDILRASVPLMELASDLCLARASKDPTAAPLRAYLRQHIDEERGHDDWLSADLAALGPEPSARSSRPPAPVVARLVGAQYYWLQHHHPVALLGYIAVLEANAPAPRLARYLTTVAGIPETASRTVAAHAALDPGHSAEVFALCDALRLTAQHVDTVTLSGLTTAHALLDVYDHVIRTASDGGEP
jgi:hypothetical protein